MFRASTLEALERAGRRYRVTVETPSLTRLRAAVLAGLGLTCRMGLFGLDPAMPRLVPGSLPATPDIGYRMLTAADPSAATARLAKIMARAALELPDGME